MEGGRLYFGYILLVNIIPDEDHVTHGRYCKKEICPDF
jgi:hypothetical protein